MGAGRDRLESTAEGESHMRSTGSKLALFVLLGVLASPSAGLSQERSAPRPDGCTGCGAFGNGRAHAGARGFDPKSVTTIQGEVLDIERFGRGRHQGVHLALAMGSETVSVRLGPDFYVDAQALKLAKGDKVEVKGTLLSRSGEAIIVAQEVRRGDEVLVLRDASGVPLWRAVPR
jgi:hypothetical protein